MQDFEDFLDDLHLREEEYGDDFDELWDDDCGFGSWDEDCGDFGSWDA